MAQWRVTMFFKDSQYGATENWWWRRTSDNLSVVTAGAAVLAELRADMLGSNVDLFKFRVSDDQVFRDSHVIPFDAGQVTGDPNPADNPYSNLLYRVEAGANVRGMRQLFGVPDLYITDQVFTPAPHWDGKFRSWAAELATNWALLGVQQGGGAPAVQTVTAVVINADNTLTLTVPAHGFTAGQMTHIRQLKFNTGTLNGRFRVTVVNADTVIPFGLTVRPGSLWLRVGTIQAVAYALSNITSTLYQRPGHRNRGVSPLSPSRGRRRSRSSAKL